MKRNRIITGIIATAMATTIIAGVCVTVSALKNPNQPKASETKMSSMANPWKECKNNMEKAEKISGIHFDAPEFSNYSIRAMKGMIEIEVKTNDADTITYRISTEDGDISGVCDDFIIPVISDSRIDNLNASFRTKDNKVYVVLWDDGKYNYSMSCDKGMSLEEAIVTVDEFANGAKTEDIKTSDMENPWTDCKNDTAKAEKISGVHFAAPEFSNYSIRAMKGMIEIEVKTNDADTITYRISTEDGDISGVCDDFIIPVISDSRIDNLNASFRTKDNKVYVVLWDDGKYNYSMSCDKGMSLEEAIVTVSDYANSAV